MLFLLDVNLLVKIILFFEEKKIIIIKDFFNYNYFFFYFYDKLKYLSIIFIDRKNVISEHE